MSNAATHLFVSSLVVVSTIFMRLILYAHLKKRLDSAKFETSMNGGHSPERMGQNSFSTEVHFIKIIGEVTAKKNDKRRIEAMGVFGFGKDMV